MNLKTEIMLRVSTVLLPSEFLGLNPDPYETCIFGPNSSEVVERYATIEAAEEGHQRWVTRLSEAKIG